MPKLEQLDPREYYLACTKKQKGLILKALEEKYGYRPHTISRKLMFKSERKLLRHEFMAVSNVIKNELWKELSLEPRPRAPYGSKKKGMTNCD